MKVKTKILFFFFRIFQSVFLEASIRNFCLKYKFRIYIILECEIILKIQLTSEILPCHRIRCAFVRALGVDGRTRCTLHTAQFDWQTMFDLEFRFVYSLLIFMNIRVEIFEIFLYIYINCIFVSKIVKILGLLENIRLQIYGSQLYV